MDCEIFLERSKLRVSWSGVSFPFPCCGNLCEKIAVELSEVIGRDQVIVCGRECQQSEVDLVIVMLGTSA